MCFGTPREHGGVVGPCDRVPRHGEAAPLGRVLSGSACTLVDGVTEDNMREDLGTAAAPRRVLDHGVSYWILCVLCTDPLGITVVSSLSYRRRWLDRYVIHSQGITLINRCRHRRSVLRRMTYWLGLGYSTVGVGLIIIPIT